VTLAGAEDSVPRLLAAEQLPRKKLLKITLAKSEYRPRATLLSIQSAFTLLSS
jgi:hypothetical protein